MTTPIATNSPNKLQQEKDNLVKSLQKNKQDPRSWNHLGKIFLSENNTASSVQCYNNAIKLDPNYIEAYQNLASIQNKIGQYKQAALNHIRALNLSIQDAKLVNIIRSEIDISSNEYKDSLYMGPNSINIIQGYIECILFTGHYRQAAIFIQHLKQQLNIDNNYNAFHLYELFINYLNNDLNKCIQIINTRIHSSVASNIAPQAIKFLRYYNYLCCLTEYRQKNPKPLEKLNDLEPIHIIGDSHCLVPAFTKIQLKNKQYETKPFLVMDTQARHLSLNDKSLQKTAITNYLKNLSPNEKVIVMFGEIDCRIGCGIISHHKKTGKTEWTEIKKTINQIVTGYSAFFINLAKRHYIDLIFYGVPHPKPYGKASDKDYNMQKQVVVEFNKQLFSIAKQNNYQYIDIFKRTVDEQSNCIEEIFLDQEHIKPNIVIDCIEEHFS